MPRQPHQLTHLQNLLHFAAKLVQVPVENEVVDIENGYPLHHPQAKTMLRIFGVFPSRPENLTFRDRVDRRSYGTGEIDSLVDIDLPVNDPRFPEGAGYREVFRDRAKQYELRVITGLQG
jgi:hypothetical protein